MSAGKIAIGCAILAVLIFAVDYVVSLLMERHYRRKRDADLARWCMTDRPRKSHYVPPKDVASSRFAVGRDCFTDRKGVWKL